MKEAVSQAAALPRLRGQVRTFGERPNTNKKGGPARPVDERSGPTEAAAETSPDCECLEHGGRR